MNQKKLLSNYIRNNCLYLCHTAVKKFLTAILALLYFATSTGATVHMHYCMGKLVENKLWHSKAEKCGQCGMTKSPQKDNGCCKDEQKRLKIEKEHKVTETVIPGIEAASLAFPVSYIEGPAIALSSITEENPTSNAPPRSSESPIYKRNCVFRI